MSEFILLPHSIFQILLPDLGIHSINFLIDQIYIYTPMLLDRLLARSNLSMENNDCNRYLDHHS